jgi:hypothetical protein
VADKPQVNVTVWRDGEENDRAAGHGSTHRARHRPHRHVGRATLQAPHRAMIAQRGIPPEGVYVGYFAYGSPATRYGLFPGRRIVEWMASHTRSRRLPQGGFGQARPFGHPVAHHHWNNAPEVITLKLDRIIGLHTSSIARGRLGAARS